MRLVSFDLFRSIGLPGVTVVKPERYVEHREVLAAADWVLFPPSWLVNAMSYALRRRVFPSLASYHLGYDKLEQTRAFQLVAPDHTPATLILPPTAAAAEQAIEGLGLPLVVKRPRDSQGRGVALIETADALAAWVAGGDVLYAQERLPIDRDLRVVWVGDAVVAAYWRIATPGEFLNNVARGGTLSFDDIPAAGIALVERVARALGIDHAGFDLAVVDGHPYLLELNLFFGTEGLERSGVKLAPLIAAHLARSSDG